MLFLLYPISWGLIEHKIFLSIILIYNNLSGASKFNLQSESKFSSKCIEHQWPDVCCFIAMELWELSTRRGG